LLQGQRAGWKVSCVLDWMDWIGDCFHSELFDTRASHNRRRQLGGMMCQLLDIKTVASALRWIAARNWGAFCNAVLALLAVHVSLVHLVLYPFNDQHQGNIEATLVEPVSVGTGNENAPTKIPPRT
jgi:hypothetical protein